MKQGISWDLGKSTVEMRKREQGERQECGKGNKAVKERDLECDPPHLR